MRKYNKPPLRQKRHYPAFFPVSFLSHFVPIPFKSDVCGSNEAYDPFQIPNKWYPLIAAVFYGVLGVFDKRFFSLCFDKNSYNNHTLFLSGLTMKHSYYVRETKD